MKSGAKLVKVSTLDEADLVVESDVGPSIFGSYNNMKSYTTPSFSPDSKTLAIKGLYRFGEESFLEKWLPPKFNPFRESSTGSVVRIWDVANRREVLTLE